MNINDMPDDNLILILKQFTLQEQLELVQVCIKWETIIEELCQAKQSLKLFDDISNVGEYCSDLLNYNLQNEPKLAMKPIGVDNELILDQPNSRLSNEKWHHLFPNVKEVVLYGDALNPESSLRSEEHTSELQSHA